MIKESIFNTIMIVPISVGIEKYERSENKMDYCDEINDIIICVLNDVSDKIKKDLCTREDVNDILLEYTLDIHDIVLDEIMDRIEYY